MENIRYLVNKDIDKEKWDNCIDNAANGLIYGYSFYLDAMAKNWDALVLNDYEAVMPLTWNKKYGICYLYQPPFLQQLGIFNTTTLREEVKNAFIMAGLKRFRFVELFVNFKIGEDQPNFILPLHEPFEKI
jgi:hypothetical protein